MIELEVQFQIVIGSILFGLVATNIYTFIDIIFKKSKVLKGLIELCFFIIVSGGYYCFVYIINKGIFNVYMPASLLLGRYLHYRFYDKYFSCIYEYIFSKIHCIINIKKRKWRKIWKELIKKKTKEVKSTE